METKNAQNLAEFEAIVTVVENDLKSNKPHEHSYISSILFRGQSEASWSLDTTLERYGKRNLDTDEYVRYLAKVLHAIESYTDRKFHFKYDNPKLRSISTLGNFRLLEGQYELMVYLRHHGFPSPLLDWTRSPYVALFFACQDIQNKGPAAVYLYIENIGNGKGGFVGAPEILTLGSNVTSHKRHFMQQSEYTMCVAGKENECQFHPHETVFGNSDSEQDRIIKIIIAADKRIEILKKLDAMNINAFSLFGSEEGLMDALAFREIY